MIGSPLILVHCPSQGLWNRIRCLSLLRIGFPVSFKIFSFFFHSQVASVAELIKTKTIKSKTCKLHILLDKPIDANKHSVCPWIKSISKNYFLIHSLLNIIKTGAEINFFTIDIPFFMRNSNFLLSHGHFSLPLSKMSWFQNPAAVDYVFSKRFDMSWLTAHICHNISRQFIPSKLTILPVLKLHLSAKLLLFQPTLDFHPFSEKRKEQKKMWGKHFTFVVRTNEDDE